MDRNGKITLIVLAGIILVAALITLWITRTPDVSSEATQLAPYETIVYTDIYGNPVSLQDTKPAVRVLNSWATWCPFCVTELADFETVATEYVNQGHDVEIVAINRGERSQVVQAFLKTIPDLQNTRIFLDAGDDFYTSISGFTMPETIVYNAAGEVVLHKRGPLTEAEIRGQIQVALESNL